MNQSVPTTSAPGSSLLPDSIGMLTTANFALIALFAALVLAGLIWGARQKRRRKQAEREVAERNTEIEATPSPRDLPRAEPAPAIVPVAVSPAPIADASPSTDAANGPLTQLKGLGPKVETRLGELGFTTVGQLAALRDDQAAELDAQLGAFAGRLSRDRWIEQARFLAAGDVKGFEAVFGRL